MESQSSNSYMEKEAFVHVVNTVEEIAQVQKKQLDMLQAQQGSINDLKKMLTLLLDRKQKKSPKKSRSHTSSSKGKGKKKEGKNSAYENIESENPKYEKPWVFI